MYKLSGLNKSFSANNANQVVLNDININIQKETFTAISGPSGSGKSTLLAILSGLEKADSGNVVYENVDLSTLNQNQLSTLRSREFGFIFQSPFFIPYKSLIDNIKLPISYSDTNADLRSINEWAYELAELVGLSSHLHKSPALLSGGEQQRMAFARALVLNPNVIFADEPTASLDHENADILLSLLRSEVSKRKSVILVSHDKQAIAYADTVFALNKKGSGIVEL